MNIFLKQTGEIKQLKKGFDSPLGGVLKYKTLDDIYLSTCFFESTPITQNSIVKKIDELSAIFFEIKSQKQQIGINQNYSSIEKKFLLNQLNSFGLKIMLFRYSIYMEAEKGGFSLLPEIRKKYLKKINTLQDMIYGYEISSSPQEIQNISNTMHGLLDKKGTKLTADEITLLKQNIIPPKNPTPPPNRNTALTNNFLDRKSFLNILSLSLDIYGLDEYSISVEDVGSFSVQHETKKIIVPEQKIETTSIKRLLELIDHEIGVHALRGHNQNKTLKTAGDGYLEFEEGFASLGEKLFDTHLDNIHIIPEIAHISTYFAENNNLENTQKLIEIYLKLTTNNDETNIRKIAKERALRVKRFVSFQEKGANRKDVSYTRGQQAILEYLQNTPEGFTKRFYFSKLSQQDLSLVEEFKNTLMINESELKYPLWIGKIIYKKLIGEKIFLENLKKEDIRFDHITHISFETKRKIIKILQNIREKKEK